MWHRLRFVLVGADNNRGNYSLKLNRTVFLALVLSVFVVAVVFKRHCRTSVKF